jgi:outer membrane immunogenic protein
MWTGFYVGLNAGGTWANSNQQVVAVGPVGAGTFWSPGLVTSEQPSYLGAFSLAASGSGFNSGNNGGFIGGGQVGYNWQVYNSFVLGVEADIQGLSGNSATRTVATGAAVPGLLGGLFGDSFSAVHSIRGGLDYLGTVRGRLGWLFTPTLLVYGTGGFAFGGATLNYGSVVTPGGFGGLFMTSAAGGVNYSDTQPGWTAGGGLEWMFMPNWSAKAEYLYYDLGTVTQGFALVSNSSFLGAGPVDTAIFGGQVRARLNGNVVRAGVNYHFNWGAAAPVVARY